MSCHWVAKMHDVTDIDWFEGIRAFVDNEDGSFPELADLPAAWDAVKPPGYVPGFVRELG